jgi:hypothetical protein
MDLPSLRFLRSRLPLSVRHVSFLTAYEPIGPISFIFHQLATLSLYLGRSGKDLSSLCRGIAHANDILQLLVDRMKR